MERQENSKNTLEVDLDFKVATSQNNILDLVCS